MDKNELVVTTVIPKDHWKDVKLIAVDIETNTEDPLGKKEGLGGYGLSYVTDITDVALLDISGNRGIVFHNPTKKQQRFIAKVLGRDHITIVAHNAVFDLRNLGGHYGFQIARNSLVWDTKTIGVRMLMGNKQGRGFDLQTFYDRLGLKYHYPKEFIAEMKEQRKNLSNLAEALKALSTDNPIWGEVDGYIPPTAEQVLFEEAAKKAIAKYVLSDTLMAAEIYKKQLETAVTLDKNHARIGLWYHVPVWKALKENLDWWLRGLRVATNQSIVGVKIDIPYAKKLMGQYQEIIEEKSDIVFGVEDTSDPYAAFNEVISTLYYYSRVLDVCRDSDNTYSKPTGWKFWKFVKLSKAVIKDSFNTTGGEFPDEWVDFLLDLDPEKATRGQVLKNHPLLGDVPVIDLEEYIERVCFKDKYGSRFLAKTKAKWWVSYYTATKSDNPTRKQMLNKKSFKPYYLFVICGLDLPSKELVVEFPKQLLTKKGFAPARVLLKENRTLPVMRYMLDGFLSFGKDAISVYMTSIGKKDDRFPKAGAYKEFLEATAKVSMINELLLHARRDGRIHSLIVPSTRTGRDTSSSPNLQNLNMKIMRGILIGDEGRVLMELDLSNAENVTAAMIAGDDKLAAATEEGDFHSTMAAIYFAKEWKAADADRRKELRGMGKSITFGTAYGMGVFSMQIELREDGVYLVSDKIRKIIRSKDNAYPKVVAKKKSIIRESKARVAHGFMPAYVPLWSKERVQTPYDDYGIEIQYRNEWNHAQQGGVATVVHRSMTEAQEWLEDEDYETRIAINIHDSDIPNVVIEEVNEAIPKISEFMGSQVPDIFCRRTTPMVHFVSAVGPENAEKWGYVDGQDYPLPLDKFYNQWGVHAMPEGEDEAPTWRGPVHKGWTLKGETQAIKHGMSLDDLWKGQAILSSEVVVDKNNGCRPSLSNLKKVLVGLSQLEKGYKISLPSLNGGDDIDIEVEYRDLPLTLQLLQMKGHDKPVQVAVDEIKSISLDIDMSIQALQDKKKELESIYDKLPYQQETVNNNTEGQSPGDEEQKSAGHQEERNPVLAE